MEDMNFDKIGDELVKAYEDGYQKGLKENKILADAENRKLELLQKQVLDWAEEKDLLHEENADKQFMKFIEEVFEFKTEMDNVLSYTDPFVDEAVDRLMLEMGDILVTLIILSKQLEIDLVECLEMAYKKISKRKGKTINGVFIKSEDFKNERV